jgi:hypothetical protein
VRSVDRHEEMSNKIEDYILGMKCCSISNCSPICSHLETVKTVVDSYNHPLDNIVWLGWVESRVTQSKWHPKLLAITRYRLIFFKKQLIGKGVVQDRNIPIMDLSHILSEEDDKVVCSYFFIPYQLNHI